MPIGIMIIEDGVKLLFKGSPKATLGVEIELQIIDVESLDLSPQSEKILANCQKEKLDRITTEIHQSMIEVNSEVSDNIKQCRQFLKNRCLKLNEIVESLGFKLAVTGTHPFQCWTERLFSNHDRYHNLHAKFQWLARRMNIYGTHVHVGVPSGDRALAISQALIQYLPHLLALSANSPFWQGIDTGMQSSRVNILDTFPFSGIPLNVSRWSEFERYYSTLHKVGAITSFKDLYWYIRPNLLYGTIEVRIFDASSTLIETMALVALVQCLVAKINQELDEGIETKWTNEYFWIAPENLWIAARDGIEGMLIVNLQGKKQKIADAVLELLEILKPTAMNLDCNEELQYVQKMLKQGNGATRQREVYQQTGSLKEVVATAQKEFVSSLLD